MKLRNTILTFATAMFYCVSGAAQTSAPPQAETIIFHLPIHSRQFPDLVTKLQNLLREAELPNITLQAADFWSSYQQDLRIGKPGIYFAAPHFVAWAVQNHSFRPLLRLSEPLQYVVAAERSDLSVFEINDLNKKKVCTKRALNLDYLLVNTAFDNTLLAAEHQPVWSVIDLITSASEAEASRCVAYVISAHQFKRLQAKQPDKFIRLQQGQVYSNYAFMVDPGMTPETIARLREVLLSEPAQSALGPLYRQTAASPNLIDATQADYSPDQAKPLTPYWRTDSALPAKIR